VNGSALKSHWPATLQSAAERCGQELTAEECYERLEAQGLQYGPEFRGMKRVAVGRREAVGELFFKNAAHGPFRVPPNMLDSALQGLAVLAAAGQEQGASPLLPAVVRSVRVLGPCTDQCYFHAKLEEGGEADTFVGSVALHDAQGTLAVQVEGLVLRPAGTELSDAGWTRAHVLSVGWEERAPAPRAAGPRPPGRPWLWILGEDGAARALAEALKARGQPDLVATWRAGGEAQVLGGAAPPRPGTRWEELLDGSGLERAIWLAPPGDPGDLPSACERLVELYRGAARSRRTLLTLVTFGAHGRRPAPSQAALWGLARVCAREHPGRWGGAIDLPEDLRADAAGIADAVGGACDAEVALQGGHLQEPRLRRSALPTTGARQPPFHGGATYLVTGGLGGVGLALAEWMVERGATRLLLLGRRAPPPEAVAAISALEARGAKVRALQGDVALPEDVARALREPAALGWPPVKGVFHLAAAVVDGVMELLDPARIRAPLAPKVSGSWNLHQATAGLPLEHFVLFSSIASLGTAGQAAYAAGNTFMDALARRRRADGLPALSVGFGAFAEVGAAARQAEKGVRGAAGVEPMPPARALNALGAVLSSPEPHLFIAGASWPAFAAGLPPGAARLYADLLEQAAPGAEASSGEAADFSAWVRAQPRQVRREALATHIGSHVTRILGLAESQAPAPDQPLMQAGLDSLMTVQLRNALRESLQVELPVTLLFDHPTIGRLAEHLATLLGPGEAESPAAADPGGDIAAKDLETMLSELEELPEEEVALRLRDSEPGN